MRSHDFIASQKADTPQKTIIKAKYNKSADKKQVSSTVKWFSTPGAGFRVNNKGFRHPEISWMTETFYCSFLLE